MARHWHPDGTGIGSGGDDCGGDIQRGDSYSVRFARDDLPGSLLTITFYAVEYDRAPGVFAVQRETEWLVCTDPANPGGTELWSDYHYDDLPDWTRDTARLAEQEALRRARDCLRRSAEDIGWDGRPFRVAR